MQGFVVDLRCQAGHLRFDFESNIEDWLASQALELESGLLVFARKQTVHFYVLVAGWNQKAVLGRNLFPSGRWQCYVAF